MNDYTKPFFIGIKRYNRKGEYLRTDYGYLPPLELPHEEAVVAYADMQWTNRQEGIIKQHSARMNYLENKFNEHISVSSKKKSKY